MRKSPNQDVKDLMRQKNIRQWEVAEKLGISEFTFSRYISRKPLDKEFKEKIINAISELEKEVQQ